MNGTKSSGITKVSLKLLVACFPPRAAGSPAIAAKTVVKHMRYPRQRFLRRGGGDQ